jgi:hypothetical protein
MEILRSYIVRVYRQEADTVTGVIESVEMGFTAPFRSSEELWTSICQPSSRRRSFPLDSIDEDNGT